MTLYPKLLLLLLRILCFQPAQPLPDPLALQRAEGMARKRMIQGE